MERWKKAGTPNAGGERYKELGQGWKQAGTPKSGLMGC